MTTEIRVPQLPESVADATLVAWHKQPGDSVSRDENLADLETAVAGFLAKDPSPTPARVRELIAQFRVIASLSVSDEEAEQLARVFEARHSITMTIGLAIMPRTKQTTIVR